MSNPLSLRLCCLATMAPALTSEAATRARDKLPGSPAPPSTQVTLVNGRDCHMNSLTKVRDTCPVTKSGTELVTLTKELQQKLTETGHLADVNTCFRTSNQQKVNLINLGSIANISSVYKPRKQIACKTSILNPRQFNQLVGPTTTTSTMSSTKMKMEGSATVASSATPGTTNGLSHISTAVQSKVSAGTTQHPTQSILKSNTSSTQQGSLLITGSTKALLIGGNNVPTTSRNMREMSNGFNGLSQKSDPGVSGTTVKARPPIPATTLNPSVSVPDNTGQKKQNVTKSCAHSVNQLLDNVARRQRQLETKTARLLKQLRRLQSRQAISHSKQQLSGLVEQQQKSMQSSGRSRTSEVDFKTELLQSQNAKGMSTAALVSLIHKWQCAQTSSLRSQLSNPSREPESSERLEDETCIDLDRVSGHLSYNLTHLQSGLDSDATESSSGGESCEEWDYDDDWDSGMPRPPIECRAEWKWANDRAAVAARWTWLQAQVSDLEYRIRQQYDIYKQIRASKGSVTLGDPPAPEDITIKIGTDKGKMTPLDEKIAKIHAKNEISPSNISTLLSNVDKQSNLLRTQQLGPLYTPQDSPGSISSGSTVPNPKTPNGFVDNKCENSKRTAVQGDISSLAPDYSYQAARCRPVRSYRKRKLLRTTGLHNLNRKAARLSTVHCHCYPSMSPCAMCGGRYNNTVQMEAETMPHTEKIALVDMSFHPVLSFPQDVSISTHFESMLKTGEWQQKPPPRTYKVLQTDRRRPKLSESVRKYTRKVKSKNTSATILSSAKIKNKYEQKQINRTLIGSPSKTNPNRECTKLSHADIRLRKRKAALQNLDNDRQKGLFGSLPTIKHDGLSPSGQPLSLKEIWLRKKRERGESAYDINNIVIPYSIAASTRVEKLQYKEILTPKWREISELNKDCKVKIEPSEPIEDTKPSPVTQPEKVEDIVVPKSPVPIESTSTPEEEERNEEELEDLCDEVFRLRHVQCEVSEKKRFSTIVPLLSSSSQRRSRGAQRADSTQTSDQTILPLDVTTAEEGSLVSRVSTPPLTPKPPEETDEPPKGESLTLSENARTRSSSISSSMSARSRSASYSEERPRPMVSPWPKRNFPLTSSDFETLVSDEDKNEKKSTGKVPKVITEGRADLSSGYVYSPGQQIGSDDGSEEVQEEDPDDPEWTVVSEKPLVLKQPNIVLKLAKR